MSWLAAHPWLELTVVSIGLILDAIFGAWLSTKVRAQIFPIWITFLSGNISILIWAYLSKFSKMQLVAASLFFDIVYNTTWMLAMIYFGSKLTGYQLVGALLVVVGIGFFGLGGE